MSQNDMTIANQGFPATRSDINSALQALASTSSGATEPATMFANQLWFDTAANKLKIRNEANSAWYDIVGINESTGALTLNSATIGATTAAAGTFTTLTTSSNATIGGTAVMSTSFLRNRIINGDMRVDQRNAAASITASGGYALDRWVAHENTDGAYTVQQVTTAPTGYTNSLKATVTVADTSIGASQNALIAQYIEGYNVADLGYGTAAAQTVTLSFWVNSSLTGTFSGSLQNSASDRSYPFTYTISVANTWEQKTVTITGDTSGTWLTTNGVGIRIWFALAAGSSVIATAGAWVGGTYYGATGQANWMATVSNTFYLTGVQLEVGTVATPFERQIYSNQLAQCQRYYGKTFLSGTAPAQNAGTTASLFACSYTVNQPIGVNWKYPATMRAAPTITTYSPDNASANWSTQGGSRPTVAVQSIGDQGVSIRGTTAVLVNASYEIHAAADAEL